MLGAVGISRQQVLCDAAVRQREVAQLRLVEVLGAHILRLGDKPSLSLLLNSSQRPQEDSADLLVEAKVTVAAIDRNDAAASDQCMSSFRPAMPVDGDIDSKARCYCDVGDQSVALPAVELPAANNGGLLALPLYCSGLSVAVLPVSESVKHRTSQSTLVRAESGDVQKIQDRVQKQD